MANIYDIAKKAGVSIATVSKVVNNKDDVGEATKKRIRKIMQEENYIPNSVARSLSNKNSKLIGIIFNYEHSEGINNSFFQEVIYGVEKAIGQAGFDFVYFADQKWHDYNYNYLEKCKDRMVDGAILLGIEQNEHLQKLLDSEIPVITIDLDFENNNSSFVRCDNEDGAKEGVEYLFELGHEKIGILGPTDLNPSIQRITGYKKALKNNGIKVKEDYIIECEFTEQSAYAKVKEILTQNTDITALFCQSDVIAIAAIRAIKDFGYQVPEDFSVVGFDNIEIGKYITPTLTTISQHSYKLGEVAAKTLLDFLLKKSKKMKSNILDTELLIRESCQKLEEA